MKLTYLPIYPSLHLPIHLSIYPSFYSSICLFNRLSICLPIYIFNHTHSEQRSVLPLTKYSRKIFLHIDLGIWGMLFVSLKPWFNLFLADLSIYLFIYISIGGRDGRSDISCDHKEKFAHYTFYTLEKSLPEKHFFLFLYYFIYSFFTYHFYQANHNYLKLYEMGSNNK